MKKLKEFRTILSQRNALLQKPTVNKDIYELWTKKLLDASNDIQKERSQFLKNLEIRATDLLGQFFDNQFRLIFTYHQPYGNPEELYHQELRYKRSLFGAHLDDFLIAFNDKRSRYFASRGQQKLILLLIKIAQMNELTTTKGDAIFLLDDILSDFDPQMLEIIITMLHNQNKGQCIFTCPSNTEILLQSLHFENTQMISLG